MSDRKGSILIVDDEQVVLKSCERVLGQEGYAVKTTTSAKAALAMLGDQLFDLVITDMKMPEMDGIELIRQVRQTHPNMNIIVITGFPSQENIKDALGMRIVDYLPKPFSPSLLLETVGGALSLTKAGTAPNPEVEVYTDEVAAQLDAIIAKFRKKPGSLIPVLQEAQGLVGYLPPVVQRHVARGLNVPVSEVHGVVSFYHYFTMKPKGRHAIKVCLGTACYVKRAEEIVVKLREQLKINMGEVTPDRKFSLESVRCLGACGLAPVVVIDTKQVQETYGSINPVETHKILEHYTD
jgi:NADH-quinone oxidoreductase subunit E/NADP-reducing hydrogenase subunit HndA